MEAVATKPEEKKEELKEVPPVSDKDIKTAVTVAAAADEVPLNTSEDAVMAYLRDQIDEETLRRVVGKYGRVSYHWLTKEQIKGFSKELPEDLVFDRPADISSREQELEGIKEKEEQREKAMRDALKDSDDPEEKRALERDLERLHPKKKTSK